MFNWWGSKKEEADEATQAKIANSEKSTGLEYSQKFDPSKFDPTCMRERLERFLKLATRNTESVGWKKAHGKDGFSIYTKYREGDKIVIVRGDVDVVQAPAEEVFNFLVPVATITKYDIMAIEGTTQNIVVGDHHLLQSCAFRTPWPLSPRDFVWIQEIKELSKKDAKAFDLPEGTFYILSQSVDYDKIPPNPKCVRGEILDTGILITPVSENTCSVTYVLQVDPKGWVPTFIVNLAATDQATNVLRIREYFAANPVAEKPKSPEKPKKKKKSKSKSDDVQSTNTKGEEEEEEKQEKVEVPKKSKKDKEENQEPSRKEIEQPEEEAVENAQKTDESVQEEKEEKAKTKGSTKRKKSIKKKKN